jgi:class 3 adenylate cyclase/tetratricopeptide (TPR) repeat protein
MIGRGMRTLVRGGLLPTGRRLPDGTVTFLFSDVEGSVRLWEESPHAMGAALARLDQLVAQAVAQHRGRLVRPRGEGDSHFAVFGRAADAVAAALDVQRRVAREEWPTTRPLRMRMAAHTGRAELRMGDYYGGDVNRCARLRGMGHGGQILLSGYTASLIEHSLPTDAELVSLGEHALRDLKQPEHVFCLRHPDLPAQFPPLTVKAPAADSASGSADFLPGYPFPTPDRLIGRERELQRFERVLEQGRTHGQTVFIGAPAGTGKSALLGAIVRRAHELGTLCLAGGCYESEARVPLRPFRDGIVDYALALPGDELRTELGELATELAQLAPELRLHLGLTERSAGTPDLDQARLFGTLHACLRGLTRRTPVLLCLEDLHDADAATLDLIQFLVRQAHQLPFVVVGTYRGDEVRPGQPLARLLTTLAREGAEELTLEPLGADDTLELAASLLGGPVSEPLGEALYATTSGNALFLEQLVLTLREEQRIDRLGGVWRPVGEIQGVLPALVRHIVERRLDRLSAACRRVLGMAAVLGRSFDHLTLLRACQPSISEVEVLDTLEEALDAQIVQETGGGYAFVHTVLRETLYWGLSTPRRQLLHARAGQVLEQLAGPAPADHASELAHHFSLGGRDPQVRRKALLYSMQAARDAAALSSYREARAHFARACELIHEEGAAAEPDVQLEALQGRALAERNLGRWAACIDSFRLVLEQTTDPVARAQAHCSIGRALSQTGERVGALAAYQAGLTELAHASGPQVEPVRLELLYQQAFCYLLEGRFRDVLHLGERMLEGALRLDEPSVLYRAHSVVALGWMHQGHVDRALQPYQAALAAAEQSGDKLHQAVAHENVGANHYRGGNFEAARAELRQAVECYRLAGGEVRSVLARQLLARVALAEGHLDEALLMAQHARALALEGGDRWQAQCDQVLGAVFMLRAEWDQARTYLEQALAAHERVGHAVGVAESLIDLGLVCQQLGEPLEAEHRFRRAHAVSQTVDPCPVTVSAARHLGQSLLEHGRPEEAARYICAAVTLVRSMPGSLQYAPTLLAQAELEFATQPTSAIERAAAALEAARAVDVRLAAHLFLARAFLQTEQARPAVHHADRAIELAEASGSAWLIQQARRLHATVAP